MATEKLTSDEYLAGLSEAVWRVSGGNKPPCPPDKVPTFRQLDDLISTTAWGADAREEFFRRWVFVEKMCDKRFDGINSIAELAHLTWQEVDKVEKNVKHPLATLIHAWHEGPVEVDPVRDGEGNLRGDTIAPRIAMRSSGTRADRLYLPPAHFSLEGDSGQMVLPGLAEGNPRGTYPGVACGVVRLRSEGGRSERWSWWSTHTCSHAREACVCAFGVSAS